MSLVDHRHSRTIIVFSAKPGHLVLERVDEFHYNSFMIGIIMRKKNQWNYYERTKSMLSINFISSVTMFKCFSEQI